LLASDLHHLLTIHREVGLLLSPLPFCLALLLHLVFFVVELIMIGLCVTLRRVTIRPSKFLLLTIMLELRWSHHLVARGRRLRHAFREPGGQTRVIRNGRVQPVRGRGRPTILEHIFGFGVRVSVYRRFALVHV
jgi:hypothetical protein